MNSIQDGCKTDKDCMYSVGIGLGGFDVDRDLPDTHGQPEKSLVRHLCKSGLTAEEIKNLILEIRKRAYLRRFALKLGKTDATVDSSLMQRLFALVEQGAQFDAICKQLAELPTTGYLDSLGL